MTRLLLPALLLALAMPPLQAAQPASLPDWDALTPAQRELLIAPQRARWNDSSPHERARLLRHAQRWQAMTPEQRAAARKGMRHWEGMPPRRREHAIQIYRLTRDMTPVQREAFVQQWRTMTPEQRRKWIQEHAATPKPAP